MACALALAFASASSFAQGVLPGRIERDTRPVPEPVARDAVRIPRASFAEQVPPGADGVRFVLGGVVLTGASALAATDLQDAWLPLVGRSITLREAFGIAGAVSARYREAGFVLSQALLPAQDLPTAGPATLRIQVVEGYVERAVAADSSDTVSAYLAPVTQERPLRLETLERALLLVNELPGMSAQGNLAAGTAPGASELELATQVDPGRWSLLVHNRSTPSLGRVRIEASAERRGLLGRHDAHALRLVSSGDQRLRMLAYQGEVPVGGAGTRLQWQASHSRSEPDSPLPNVDTSSTALALGAAHPLLRSRATSVTLRGQLAGYDNGAGDETVSRDHIRALRLGVTADHADALGGISLVDAEFSQGLDRFGASAADDPLLNGARPDFRKLTAYLARLQSLGGDLSLLVAATAQWSDDKLPTAEQLGLGGDVFLRAFDPSEVIGENGHALKLELRWNVALGPLQATAYLFGESGRVQRRQVGAPDLVARLGASGAGLRFTAAPGVRGYVEMAKPHRRDVASQGNRDLRWFGGLGIEF